MPNLNIKDEVEDDSHDRSLPNFIDDIDDHSVAKIFCFGAFADKTTPVICNNCTGEFPLMSLDGNVCFFVMYHYETNAILATPILGLNNASILAAYTENIS